MIAPHCNVEQLRRHAGLLRHAAHSFCKRLRGSCGFKRQLRPFPGKAADHLYQHREMPVNLTVPAAGKETNQGRLPDVILPDGSNLVHQGVPYELRFQPGFLEQGSLKGEDAHHQVQHAHHLGNAAAVPCPYLRGDKINDFGMRAALADLLRQTQVESRVVDQNEAVRLVLPYPLQNGEKTLPEPPVLLEHLHHADDGGFIRPILHAGA